MPDEDKREPLEGWLDQQVAPLPPPPGTFDLITRRARRRRIRNAAVTAASGAVVAAAVVFGVTNTTAFHLTAPSESAQVAAGQGQAQTAIRPATGHASGQRTNGSASPAARASASGTAAPAASSGGQGAPAAVPANFAPASVTFVSTTKAWVIGQAGTPGRCYNGDVCTSVATTSDGGTTWQGEHAPVTGAPSGATGVSGIRFLNGADGWAFGPELWATHDGGSTWNAVSTGGARVTDLETAGDRAYALFATCSGSSASFAADCTSYTLETATAGGGGWTPVGAATSDLGAGGTATSAMLELTGSTGYLIAPDGSVYSGPIGGTWSKAGTAPCRPGAAQPGGLPSGAQLAVQDSSHLALACASQNGSSVYTSGNGGGAWSQATATTTAIAGTPTSLADTPDGAIVLATTDGISTLSPGGAQWQTAAAASGSGLPSGGFSYVGMTSDTQGVALSANTSLHEIWLTSDGGATWTPSPIH